MPHVFRYDKGFHAGCTFVVPDDTYCLKGPDDVAHTSDLCPVCGDTVSIIDVTLDERLVGSCGDAFTVEAWQA